MDRMDRLNTYFTEKERKRLDAITKDNKSGLPEMSVAEIKLSCLENGKIRRDVTVNGKRRQHVVDKDMVAGCDAIMMSL